MFCHWSERLISSNRNCQRAIRPNKPDKEKLTVNNKQLGLVNIQRLIQLLDVFPSSTAVTSSFNESSGGCMETRFKPGSDNVQHCRLLTHCRLHCLTGNSYVIIFRVVVITTGAFGDVINGVIVLQQVRVVLM